MSAATTRARRRIVVAAVVGAAALAGAVALWNGARADAQLDGSTLIVGQLQFLKNFHPLIQVNNTKRLQIGYGLLPITAFDEYAVNQCVLCETLPTLRNGLARIVTQPDGSKGMDVTLRLRPGLRWGDGQPVTARDIAFTHRMASDKGIGFSNYNAWTRAKSLRIVDGHTVILHLAKPTPSFASWDQVLPEHLEGPIYRANPDARSYTKNSLYNTDPTNPGLWNSAFRLTRYQIGTRVVFEPNPYWVGEKPKLRRIVLAYLDNSSALMLNLMANEIDAVPVSPGGISFSQMLDLRRLRPKGFTYAIADGTNLERLAVNFDNPILASRTMRQALLLGIDRQGITDVLFAGQQKVANGILSDTHPFFDPAITRYPYDPARARALLRSEGWVPGSDGICVRNGTRLSLELVTTAGNQTREQIAMLIQNQLKGLCIEIRNKFAPLQEFNGTFERRRKFTGLMLGSIDFSPSTTPRIALGSSAVPSPENSFVGNNFSGYRSKDMDAALAEYDKALTPEETRAAWRRIQERFGADLPVLPVYFYARAYVTTPDLHHFRQATYDPPMIWANEWSRR